MTGPEALVCLTDQPDPLGAPHGFALCPETVFLKSQSCSLQLSLDLLLRVLCCHAVIQIRHLESDRLLTFT